MRPTSTRLGLISLSALMITFLISPAALAGTVPAAVDCVQPDGRIRHGSGPLAGDDIFNDTGAHQRRSGSAARGSTITFRISIEFDDRYSEYPQERFLVQATGPGSSGYSVKYFRGDTDITARVVAGTYKTPRLDVGQTHQITARVKVKAGAAAGTKATRLVKVGWYSWDAYWCVDAVKFTGRRG